MADLAGTQISGTADLQLSRPDLENLAVDRLLQHFQGHIHAMSLRGTRGCRDSRVEFCFDETPEAEAAQLAAADDQRIALPASQHEPSHDHSGSAGRGAAHLSYTLAARGAWATGPLVPAGSRTHHSAMRGLQRD